MVKKILFITCIFALSSLIFAQEGEKDQRYGGYARLYSMGDNPYIVDPNNITVNPAYSFMYQNFLWGDIGSSVANPADGSGQFAGFNYGLDEDFTLGILLTRNDFMSSNSISSLDPRNLVGQINSGGVGANIIPLDNNLELLGSYNLENFVLGLGISYASTKNDYKPATGNGDKNSASQFGINLGLMSHFSYNFKFDAAISLVLPSATYEPGAAGAGKVEASNTDLLINARGFWRLSKAVHIVPAIAFYNSTGSYKIDSLSSDLPSVMDFTVGVGLYYRV
jgi:hypothetical protein